MAAGVTVTVHEIGLLSPDRLPPTFYMRFGNYDDSAVAVITTVHVAWKAVVYLSAPSAIAG